MTTIVTRAGKGSPLTHTEVDTNFTNLNTAKLETAAIPLGTLQAPSVSFLNDSDTGMFCPQGGNSLAIATGGQYAISCTSTQAVGIKTANPQKTLHVAGSTRVGADDATDAFLEIGEGATGNRSSYIDIVGDTTYTDYGVRLIRNNTGANATSEIKHRGTGNFNITTQEAGAIEFSTSNTPRVTITSGGLVGLGSSNPLTKLHVETSISTVPSAEDYTTTIGYFNNTYNTGTNGATSYTNLRLQREGNSTYRSTADFAIARYEAVGTNSRTRLDIKLGHGLTNTTDTTVMSLLSSGAVGIGTTGPSGKLDVETASDTYVNFSTTNNGSAAGICILGNNNNEFFGYANNLRFATVTGKNAAGFNERMRMDSSGRLLVGTSTSRDSGNINQPYIQREGTSVSTSALAIVRNSNDTGPSVIVLSKSRGASVGSTTVVQNGDALGAIYFSGADGSTLNSVGAWIQAEVDGTPGATDMPGRLVFSTTPDGSASPTEKMRIEQSGNIRFMNTGLVFPLTDNVVSLGLSGYRWSAVWAANGTIQTSDQRTKANIVDATLGSDFIKALRPVSYKWIEGGKRDTGERDEDGNIIYESVFGTRTHWGFIAQEVKEAVDDAGVDFGGWVLTDKDDPDSQQALRYDQFIAPLTKALQEAIAKIEALETRLSALEAQ